MFQKMRFLWLFVAVFLLCMSVSAQDRSKYNITMQHLGPEDGLAGKQVHCGLQDSEGFIWFGTSNGLQRYDGRKFRLFSKEKNGLQDNNVVGLVEDERHQLWISYGLRGSDRHPLGKVDIMDLHTGQVVSLSKKFNRMLPFQESASGVICCNEKRELIIVTAPVNNKNTVYLYTSSNGFRKVISGVAVNYGNPQLILFRGQKIMFYDEHQTSLLSLDGHCVRTDYPLTQADNLFPISISKNGQCIGATSFHSENGRTYPTPLIMQIAPDGHVSEWSQQFFDKRTTTSYNEIYFQIFYDVTSGNTLLRQQKKGLYLFDGDSFVQLADTVEMNKNRNLAVSDYFTTPGNQHWLCTSNGVMHFTMKPNHFTHLLHSASFPMPFPLDHQTRSIYADTAGNVFMNSWGGFYKAAKSKEGVYTYSKLLLSEISPLEGFYYDGQAFWFTGKEYRITRYEPLNGRIQSFEADSLNLWAGITTRQGDLLIGGTDGMGRFDYDHFERLTMQGKSQSPRVWVYQFFYSHDGILWAVSNRGLFEIDTSNKVTAHYSDTTKVEKYRLPFADILGVYEDGKGVFWMATNGAGLLRWDRKNSTGASRSGKPVFHQYTMADGLSSNVLYSVLPDEYGFLWISSEFGLMRFNTSNGVVQTYTKADGLTDDEFNRISYFKANDGRLFFGGMDGVNAIRPGDFLGDSTMFNAPFRIVSFNQYNGNKQMLMDRTEDLMLQNQITLQPGDQFFTLEFQLLDFNQGKRNYAYKIEGIDKEWNYINENSIRISGLPYGHFILHVKAQNEAGNWSRNELQIPLTVVSPLMNRWWFRAILFVLVILIIAIIYRQRTYALKRAKQSLERTVQLRTEQLKNSLGEKDVLLKEIHHRVKNNLQVVVSLLDMQQTKSNSGEAQQSFMQAKNNVRSISLIHENLYRHENLSGIAMQMFVSDLFHQMDAVYNSFDKPTELKANIAEIYLDIDTAVPFGLILNELMTNSYKYAFGDVERLIISVTLHESGGDWYEMIYSDNGKGLPEGFEMKAAVSMGMSLMKDLSRQMGGSITYSSGVFMLKFLSLKGRKRVD